jgi:asparagine synthetase B (glutamine-hydrolysing)
VDDRYRLTALEVAAGVPSGGDPHAPSLPPSRPNDTPREALERAIIVALKRPPCLVSFSGGRDSSAVLATAVHAARRNGLRLPIPVTLRFPTAPETDESAWQDRVVGHLGLDDWVRLEFNDELDLVGPIARRVLQSHGLVWPSNAHFHVPILEAATGGSLLTGIDGDVLFGGWRWVRAASVLAGSARPEPRDALRIGLALAPTPLRRLVERRRARVGLPWLRPLAARALGRSWAMEAAQEPLRWDARVRWWASRRYLRVNLWTFDLLAGDADAHVVHPLADPEFLTAVSRAGGRSGWGDRTQIMRMLFGDLLPEEVLTRVSKAVFDQVFWSSSSRSLIEHWQGEGVDPELVDPAALYLAWSSPRPPALTSSLLQAAWLASRSDH